MSTLSSMLTAGGWRVGDPVGHRRFAHLGPLALESGSLLDVTLAYETWGQLNQDGSNAILVLHALTGDSHVTGDAGDGHPSPGWWSHLVGPGKALDTTTHYVVAPNILGGCQGSTGPSSLAPDGAPYGSRFPPLSTRDQVEAERLLMRHLGIDTWALVIGGSMGGMRALEWAVSHPASLARLAVIASAAKCRADVLAWNAAQLAAITTCHGYRGGDYYHLPPEDGPTEALGVARRIAHTTYRSAKELEQRFSNTPNPGEDPLASLDGRFGVQSYLDHHATKLCRRFDAGTYVHLVRAMNTHDVGRGRGGVARALSRITARSLIVSVDSDRLFPPSDAEELLSGIPDVLGYTMHSDAGHDGFLVDDPVLDGVLCAFLSGQ